jgi:hypothetical protein
MEEDERKKETDGETSGLPANPEPTEELTWWNGRKVEFAEIMDL